MGLFSGLESLGLGKMKETKIFEPEKTEEGADGEGTTAGRPVSSAPKRLEKDVLFDKSYTCPICDNEFTSKTIRAGKTKLIEQELDLRSKYDLSDPVKYEPVVCGKCGFAALSRFFKPVSSTHAKLIQENISATFKGITEPGEVYSYEDAILRYKLVLASTVVKQAKNSERAYVCLKMAWAYRGQAENLPSDTPDREKVLGEIKAAEQECIENAYEGFKAAFSQETFPMCGMDESTVTYLVAELARRVGAYEEAGRWISQILTSRSASERLKDKARTIKDLIAKEKK